MLHVNGKDKLGKRGEVFFLGYLPGPCDSLKEGDLKQAVFFYEHSLWYLHLGSVKIKEKCQNKKLINPTWSDEIKTWTKKQKFGVDLRR